MLRGTEKIKFIRPRCGQHAARGRAVINAGTMWKRARVNSDPDQNLRSPFDQLMHMETIKGRDVT